MTNKELSNFNLSHEIYKEGENSWGCKSGWLDVEDVKEFITKLMADLCFWLQEYGELEPDDILELFENLAGSELMPHNKENKNDKTNNKTNA